MAEKAIESSITMAANPIEGIKSFVDEVEHVAVRASLDAIICHLNGLMVVEMQLPSDARVMW